MSLYERLYLLVSRKQPCFAWKQTERNLLEKFLYHRLCVLGPTFIGLPRPDSFWTEFCPTSLQFYQPFTHEFFEESKTALNILPEVAL